MGVYHVEKGGKGTPGKETAYGKTQSLKEWHIQRVVRSYLWLKRRGHVGDEKRWQSLWKKDWGGFDHDECCSPRGIGDYVNGSMADSKASTL